MASGAKEAGAAGIEAAAQRARELNETIVEGAKRGGETSLAAYERLLKTLAAYQQSAGDRAAEWVTAIARAEAGLTRELAQAGPSAARRLGGRVGELTGTAARQARRLPGVTEAEGEVRGVGATEGDLPIARYDSLNADEVNRRLSKLSEMELAKVDAYERKHRNRKTVRGRIHSLRNDVT
jgi:hypothetical protein